MSALRAALHRISRRIALLALLGDAALLLLGWAWLYIPDSHVYQFVFAMLSAAALLAGFLALHATLLRRLYAEHQGKRRTLWQSSLILAGWLFFAHILQHLTGMLSSSAATRAGYWNSQLSAHHRALFTYERLTDWQHLAIEAVLWILIPALLLPFTVETTLHSLPTVGSPWRNALRTLARPQLWLTVALAYIAGSCLGGRLLAWRPGRSIPAELLSLSIRTAVVYILAIALLLITLAVAAELLAREHARRNPTP